MGGNDCYIDQGGYDLVWLGFGDDVFINVSGVGGAPVTGDDTVCSEGGDSINYSNGFDVVFGGPAATTSAGTPAHSSFTAMPAMTPSAAGLADGSTGSDRCQFTVEAQVSCESLF